MAIRSLLIRLLLPLLLASGGAWAQNPVGTCPAGVSSAFPGCYPFIQGGALLPTDGVAVVQAGANPLSRIASVSQLLAAVGTDLPSLNVIGNATIGGTLGVTGAATFTSGLTGALTGHASLDLPLTGGTVTGATTFSGGLAGTLTGGASLDLPLAGGTVTGQADFTAQTLVNHNWTYSGTAASFSNFNLFGGSVITGTSANTSQYPVNEILAQPSLQTGSDMQTFLVWDQQQTGFWGSSSGVFSQVNQAASPTPPSLWGATTSYSPQGLLVYNGTNEYQLNSTSACTSAGSGGPTGTTSSITDGSCNWRFVTNIAQSYYAVGLASQANMTFNLGGSSSGYVGYAFGFATGANLSGSATFYSEEVGGESDAFNTLSSGNPGREVIHQFVKTGNGTQQDWGITVDGKSYNASIFQTAVMPNGVGIEFSDQSVGGLQTMAGAFDCILCSTTGTNTTSGMLVTGGGGYIIRGPSAQLLGTGDLQIGSAGFHISSQALTIDTTYEVLASVGAVSGGTNWLTGMLAVDDFGNVGTVTASAGVPSVVTLTSMPRTYVAAASVPGGAVTWHAVNANGSTLDAAGGGTIPTNFTTATETYTAGTTLDFGTTSATVLALGNSGSVTTINGTIKAGSSTGLNCSGTPTSSFASVNGIVTHC